MPEFESTSMEKTHNWKLAFVRGRLGNAKSKAVLALIRITRLRV
jgi:hypothetical protein